MLTLKLPAGEIVEGIAVYDLSGRRVFRFHAKDLFTGSFIWDGILANGNKLRSGHYVIRTGSGIVVTRRFVWRR